MVVFWFIQAHFVSYDGVRRESSRFLPSFLLRLPLDYQTSCGTTHSKTNQAGFWLALRRVDVNGCPKRRHVMR